MRAPRSNRAARACGSRCAAQGRYRRAFAIAYLRGPSLRRSAAFARRALRVSAQGAGNTVPLKSSSACGRYATVETARIFSALDDIGTPEAGNYADIVGIRADPPISWSMDLSSP